MTESDQASASPVQALLDGLHQRHASDFSGEVASYIPELADADPSLFGICLVTAGGVTYETGDTRHRFTIQSISKPLTFALALEAIGEEGVRQHVDVEPSGDAFNSITLQPGSGRPPNPMVNAGAIATTSLIKPLGFEKPIDRILNEYSAFAGRDLDVDQDVFISENRTGHRNRAIAYLMKNAGVIDDEVEDIVETYFQQCSTLVDCHDLAVMAATLASTGVNPVSHQRVLREDTVQSVLSVMASCGMYDAAGDWLYSVGLPAKSGAAGGLIAVLPGQLGLAIFSPLLDEHGNSVRGVKVCEELSKELHLHVMSPARRPPPPIRSNQTVVQCRSRHLRQEAEQHLLTEHGSKTRVIELQGEILFAAGELITIAVLKDIEELEHVVLDFTAVRDIDPIVVPIISHLADALDDAGATMVFADVDRHPAFAEAVEKTRQEAGLPAVRQFPDLDLAIDWCEDRLIKQWSDSDHDREIAILDHAATVGMDPGEVEELSSRLERREYPAGTRIYEQAGDVDEMLLVVKGDVNIFTVGEDGHRHRIATFSEGMTLGEVAMLSGRTRLGFAEAAGDVVAWALAEKDLTDLKQRNPAMVCTLLENLVKLIAHRIGNLSRNLAA